MEDTMRRIIFLATLAAAAMVPSSCCRTGEKGEAAMTMTKEPFGKTGDGKAVDLYTLANAHGMRVRIMTYGGIIVSLEVPDRRGQLADVVLGFDRLEEYLKGHPFFGALVGRYGNRIAKGQFTLDGVAYTLVRNNDENHLHGGTKGFDKVVWKAKEIKKPDAVGIELTYVSKDGEEGYPGNLSCVVTYLLARATNELRVDYEATTDKPTVVNLTQHSYFNLKGAGNGDILGHEITINADRFTPVDSGLIPTGELKPVKGTPFDFTKPVAIGARINDDDEQLRFGKGYDHNFVLMDRKPADPNIVHPDLAGLKAAAEVTEPTTGRAMAVWTTEPGVQFYVGNFLDGSNVGKGGKAYGHRYGFCLETQHFPDSPNRPSFPSVVLRPGETYRHTTVFAFPKP
jgi:aldose 1-epimerase